MYLAFNYLKLNDKWTINYIKIRPFELMDKKRFSFLKFLRKYVGFKVKTKQAVCTDVLVTTCNSVKISVGGLFCFYGQFHVWPRSLL